MNDTLIKWNAELMGAPSGVLVAIFAIAIGYILKTIPKFNNRFIPVVVVTFCTVAFMLVAPAAPDMALRIWLVRNFMLGVIIGFLAWTFHAQLLRRFVDPKIFKDPCDTNFTPKPPAPADPPKT